MLTTFSENLANLLRNKLNRLISYKKEPRLRERLKVYSMDAIGKRLHELQFGKAHIASGKKIRDLLNKIADENGVNQFTDAFLWEEWHEVVDAWQAKALLLQSPHLFHLNSRACPLVPSLTTPF